MKSKIVSLKRWPAWLALVLSLAGLAVAVPADAATTADTAPPVLTAFDFTPKMVDISNGPRTVTVTAHITDATGAQAPDFLFQSSTTSQQAGFGPMSLTSGTPQDGSYSTTVTIPQTAATGTWNAVLYPLTDTVDNMGSFGPPGGFPTTLTVTDGTTPPPPPAVTPPTISGMSSHSGRTAGKATITITGAGFTGASAEEFGSTKGTHLHVLSSTRVSVAVPAHAAGTVDVHVITPGGTSAATRGDRYTYIAPPKVNKLSSHSGRTAGQTTITITGAGFTGASAVKFGSTKGTHLHVLSSTGFQSQCPLTPLEP